MPVEMKPVQSSHVWEVGYHEESGVLHIRYRPTVKHPGGRVVKYKGVDADTAKQVMTAPSVGSAIHDLLKGKGVEYE